MSNRYESADLILKLYDLRREAKMREARNWFLGFMPQSAEDVMSALRNQETGALYRMVISYWDMAASLVVNGAIDEQMFTDAGGEHFVVFSKIEPYLAEMRTAMQNPNYLANLEKLVFRQPNAKEMLAARRETIKRLIQGQQNSAD